MKRLIGGIALYLVLLTSFIYTMVTGSPPDPQAEFTFVWLDFVGGLIGVVVLGLAIVLIAFGLKGLEKKEDK